MTNASVCAQSEAVSSTHKRICERRMGFPWRAQTARRARRLSFSQQVHKLLEVLVRGSPFADAPAGRVPEQLRPLHDLTVADDLLHLAPQLLLGRPHPCRATPPGWSSTCRLCSSDPVQELVGEVRPGQERHAVPDQGFIYRPDRPNRWGPVPVYRSGLAGNRSNSNLNSKNSVQPVRTGIPAG